MQTSIYSKIVSNNSARKTVPRKNGHQSLKSKIYKNNSHDTLKIRQNISAVILQNVTSVMLDLHHGAQISKKSMGIFPVGIGVIPVPIDVHFHCSPFPFPSQSLILFLTVSNTVHAIRPITNKYSWTARESTYILKIWRRLHDVYFRLQR